LAFKTGARERQLGGAFAVAKHAQGLGAKVTLITRIGQENEFLELVEDGLPKSISLKLLRSKTDPTIVKTRYVDELTKSKVFETYQIGETVATEDDDDQLSVALRSIVDSVDLILVADYGHGLVSQKHLEIFSKASAPKAVNTQSNAGNRGFNSISRYGSVDFVCLNGSEVGLELKQRHVALEVLVAELAQRISAKFAAVTNGAKGVVFVDSRNGLEGAQIVPAFSTRVTDRVGAGDALFVATALSWAAGNSGLISAVLGNLAGAASLAGLGNQVTIDHISMQKHMSALLK
jgi:bifunctional ADP-heptose synthase (sugar kinase/adenylyltransferase)